MKRTKSSIAIAFAALMIGSFAISPASATVKRADISVRALSTTLNSDFGLVDQTYSACTIAPIGSQQTAPNHH